MTSKLFLNSWLIVMLVTFAEPYLADALALMISGELATSSLPQHLADEMKSKWIRNLLRSGNPHNWITELTKLGATRFDQSLGKEMKTIWDRRNVIAHTAEPANTSTALAEFLSASLIVNSFVTTTDRFVTASLNRGSGSAQRATVRLRKLLE